MTFQINRRRSSAGRLEQRVMRTKATKVISVVDVRAIQNGRYTGDWGGYTVRFSVGDVKYEANTADGVRTLSMPCIVVVDDGDVSVEAA